MGQVPDDEGDEEELDKDLRANLSWLQDAFW